jgi:UDP-N-acetylmuramoyl-L-alanyl-D-glutamate--2,6-diaminopimelate ligase
MKLHQLVHGITINSNTNIETLDHIEVSGIAHNSADVKPGFVFVAIKGFSVDGHEYIHDAILSGAVAVIGESSEISINEPYIQVKNSRKALGIIAKNFYSNPSKNKLMIGITGTNGKTTTSYLIKHILERNGVSCSLFGTIQNIVNGQELKAINTTPSSLELQKLIATSNDDVVVMTRRNFF